jgi:hypothetical protein
MSFQVTILKVLAGHPDGQASLAELRKAVAILMTSGKEWTDRTKRLAARAPGLDIFAQSLVSRDATGWRITDAGRAMLETLESPAAVASTPLVIEVHQLIAPSAQSSRPGLNTRRQRRRHRRNVPLSAA